MTFAMFLRAVYVASGCTLPFNTISLSLTSILNIEITSISQIVAASNYGLITVSTENSTTTTATTTTQVFPTATLDAWLNLSRRCPAITTLLRSVASEDPAVQLHARTFAQAIFTRQDTCGTVNQANHNTEQEEEE
jgi:hypothetical protein